MTRLAQTPRVPVEGAVLLEPQLALDVALGVAGAVVGTGVALGRAVVGLPLLHQRVLWRPGFVPERWQPATLLDDAARHGAARRDEMLRAAQTLLDHWTPVIVERVVSHLDLTGLVLRHVDLDDVTGRTQSGDVLGEDQLHQRRHVSAPWRCRAAVPSRGCSSRPRRRHAGAGCSCR